MRNNFFKLISCFLLASVVFSCNNSDPANEIRINNDSISSVSNSSSIVDSSVSGMVISDIPFPFEILESLKEKQMPFNISMMNSINNIVKYTEYNQKALNLGVYGADLAYVVTNEQFEQIGKYVKTSKKLAEELNIPIAFDQNMMEKYNKFKENKDSLKSVVRDSYTRVDNALKRDDQFGLAALVVTGSWLEGLYISTKTYIDAPKKSENKELYKTISEQKASLSIVIKLLDEYKNDPYFSNIILDLKEITSAYIKITPTHIINEKELIVLNSRVEKLRNQIVKGM